MKAADSQVQVTHLRASALALERGGRAQLDLARETAIVGDPGSADTQALLSVVRSAYRPFQVVALGELGADEPSVPLLRDRGLVDGQAAAYVCREFTCRAPVTEAEDLLARLAQVV